MQKQLDNFGINDWRNSLMDTDLSIYVKMVGMAIAKYYQAGKKCYPSLTTLMQEASIGSKHTVIKAIKDLEESGFIKVKKKEIKYISEKTEVTYGD